MQLPNRRKIFGIYALCLFFVFVASPDSDPNPRGGGQLPDRDPNPRGGVNYLTLRVQFYANECNEGRDANP